MFVGEKREELTALRELKDRSAQTRWSSAISATADLGGPRSCLPPADGRRRAGVAATRSLLAARGRSRARRRRLRRGAANSRAVARGSSSASPREAFFKAAIEDMGLELAVMVGDDVEADVERSDRRRPTRGAGADGEVVEGSPSPHVSTPRGDRRLDRRRCRPARAASSGLLARGGSSSRRPAEGLQPPRGLRRRFGLLQLALDEVEPGVPEARVGEVDRRRSRRAPRGCASRRRRAARGSAARAPAPCCS